MSRVEPSKTQADELRANRNKLTKQIGALMAQGKKDEAMALSEEVTAQAQQLEELGARKRTLRKGNRNHDAIPNIIDPVCSDR